jgi:G6PDH family F420-dependent oxidoreductase
MLAEAVAIIRELWSGELMSHRGMHYVVENARIYSVPEALPDIYIAASGTESATLAGRIADGFVSTAPTKDLIATFQRSGGGSKPRYGQLTVAWGRDADKAKQYLAQQWPTAGIPGQSQQELPLPQNFEELASLVHPDQLAERVPCGPDPVPIVDSIRQYADAGYDHLAIHQVGDEAEFIRFFAQSVLPQLAEIRPPP